MRDTGPSRRSVLKLGAGLVGAAALGGAGMAVSGTAAASGPPAIEWYREIEDYKEREYNLSRQPVVSQTENGGYAVFGLGYEYYETGKSDPKFSVTNTDSEGKKQRVSLAGVGKENVIGLPLTGFLTSDGGYGFVSKGIYRNADQDPYYNDGGHDYVGLVAKMTSDGEKAWSVRLDGTRRVENSDSSEQAIGFVTEGAPTKDGGIAALGEHNGEPWFVRVAGDGTVAVDRKYPSYDPAASSEIFALDSGYLFVLGDQMLTVDESGELQDSTTLNWEIDGSGGFTMSENEIIRTGDGGIARVGETNREKLNIYVEKVDTNGNSVWAAEFNGPYEGNDYGNALDQTEDGGYLVGGSMQEAYTGHEKPTVLKLDADGNKEWQYLIDEGVSRIKDLSLSDDGGFVSWSIGYELIKFAPLEDDSTGTPTDSPDGGDSGTPEDTPEEGTDTPTAGGDSGSDGGSGDGSNGSSNGGSGGSDGESGGDCEI
jgi:hypothetical protein